MHHEGDRLASPRILGPEALVQRTRQAPALATVRSVSLILLKSLLSLTWRCRVKSEVVECNICAASVAVTHANHCSFSTNCTCFLLAPDLSSTHCLTHSPQEEAGKDSAVVHPCIKRQRHACLHAHACILPVTACISHLQINQACTFTSVTSACMPYALCLQASRR